MKTCGPRLLGAGLLLVTSGGAVLAQAPPASIPAGGELPAPRLVTPGYVPSIANGLATPGPTGPPAWADNHPLAGAIGEADSSPCPGPPPYGGVRPLGHAVHEAMQTQVVNGQAARLTLYDYDFLCGGDRLNGRGREKLLHMADLLLQSPFPLVITPASQSPALSESRRLAVLQELAEAGIPVPPEKIVIARPAALPLRGPEAQVIARNLLLQTTLRGLVPTDSGLTRNGVNGGMGGVMGGFGPALPFGGLP